MPFVGREADLQVLEKAYAEASKGQVRLVALLAESGFGKTRLAWEFYSRLSSRLKDMGRWVYTGAGTEWFRVTIDEVLAVYNEAKVAP